TGPRTARRPTPRTIPARPTTSRPPCSIAWGLTRPPNCEAISTSRSPCPAVSRFCRCWPDGLPATPRSVRPGLPRRATRLSAKTPSLIERLAPACGGGSLLGEPLHAQTHGRAGRILVPEPEGQDRIGKTRDGDRVASRLEREGELGGFRRDLD